MAKKAPAKPAKAAKRVKATKAPAKARKAVARKPKAAVPAKPPDRKPGRPSSYHPKFAKLAQKLCEFGATDIEIADALGISTMTLYRWQAQHGQFCDALKAGKEAPDGRVERSLFAKATGYTYDAVKILQYEGSPVIVPYREHVPPDTTAAIFWLKNRRPKDWREKSDAPGTAENPLVLLIQQVQGRAFKPVQIIHGEAEEV